MLKKSFTNFSGLPFRGMRNSNLAAIAATTALLATGVQAAINYVDADFTTNTTLADGTAMNLVANAGLLTNPEDYYAPGDATITPPSNWGVRSRTDTNGPTVIVASEDAQHPGVTDAPVLQTSATGLAVGTYNVYVYYRQASWYVAAGLTPGSLTNMDAGSTLAAAGDFVDTSGMNFSSTLELRQTLVGVATVSGGTLDVYIDDVPSNSQRTWYEGIGYELIPEPSVLALLGFGAIAFCRRRR